MEHTRRDTVHTDVVLCPLSAKRLSKLDNSSLRCVVTGLFLRVVDDGSGHGGNQYNRAGFTSSNHCPSNSLGHQEGSSEVDINESTEHHMVVSFGRDV